MRSVLDEISRRAQIAIVVGARVPRVARQQHLSTWCGKITEGSHTVELFLASSGEDTVFFENAHFYIEVAQMSHNACTQARIDSRNDE